MFINYNKILGLSVLAKNWKKVWIGVICEDGGGESSLHSGCKLYFTFFFKKKKSIHVLS